jgi:hypothetical protein
MYGLVNKAIKDLVVTNFGEDKWNEICELSDFIEGDFIALQSYPDDLTYTLVKNASQVLKSDSSAVLEAFGEYWILYTADEGYNELMEITGNSFVEFLQNLDMLHYRMANIMPKLEPPKFTVRNINDTSLELEYRSQRQGFVPMLFGLIRGLGKRFSLDVKITLIQDKNDENDCATFLISW